MSEALSRTGARVVHWLPETDLRNSHDGLTDLAKKKLGVRVDELKIGECIMFINSSWTAFKILMPVAKDRGGGAIVLHYKHPAGHKLNPKAVLNVPRFMRGTEINYTHALQEQVCHARFPNRPVAEVLAEVVH